MAFVRSVTAATTARGVAAARPNIVAAAVRAVAADPAAWEVLKAQKAWQQAEQVVLQAQKALNDRPSQQARDALEQAEKRCVRAYGKLHRAKGGK